MNKNEKNLLNIFLELVQTDSESFDEKNMQELLVKKLQQLGCRVEVDHAGQNYPTNAQGNVIGFFPGTVESAPIVLCAHMDTVSPGKGVHPVVHEDYVTSDGSTILGADDKAGVAIILEGLQALKEENLPHPPVEVIFTLTEENGMAGSKNLDISHLKGREGLILDNEEVSELLIQGPAVNTIEVWIKGLAAHAGACPEKGISAVEVAAYALSRMKLGRVDDETVANFGIIQGGKATNVVMDDLYLKGEARSLKDEKLAAQTAHMKACFDEAVEHFTKEVDGHLHKPEIKFVPFKRYPAVNVPASHPMVRSVVAAAKTLGISMRPAASGGGCDANILSGKGFTLPNLGVGCRGCHALTEKLLLKEFFAAFNVVLAVVRAYRK